MSTLAFALTLSTTLVYGADYADEQLKLIQFDQAIAQYMAVRQRVERDLPPLEISRDAGIIHAAVEARAAAVRAARLEAQMGDIFSADISRTFQQRIRVALEERGYRLSDIASEIEQDTAGSELPVVNGHFSWETATLMIPCLLAVLPQLPEPLQYRFVDTALVLVDIEASLIIDILPNALEGAYRPPAHSIFSAVR